MSGGLEKMDELRGQREPVKAVDPAGDCRPGGSSQGGDGASCLPMAVKDFWAEFTALKRVAKAGENVVREAIAAGNDLKATPTKPMAILARRLSDLTAIRLGVAP